MFMLAQKACPSSITNFIDIKIELKTLSRLSRYAMRNEWIFSKLNDSDNTRGGNSLAK